MLKTKNKSVPFQKHNGKKNKRLIINLVGRIQSFCPRGRIQRGRIQGFCTVGRIHSFCSGGRIQGGRIQCFCTVGRIHSFCSGGRIQSGTNPQRAVKKHVYFQKQYLINQLNIESFAFVLNVLSIKLFSFICKKFEII